MLENTLDFSELQTITADKKAFDFYKNHLTFREAKKILLALQEAYLATKTIKVNNLQPENFDNRTLYIAACQCVHNNLEYFEDGLYIRNECLYQLKA